MGSDSVVLGFSFWLATGIFILTYYLIIVDSIHKTIVAIFAGSLMLISKVLTEDEAFFSAQYGIDWDVIFLLVGMMIISNLMKPTGIFEYIAIRSAKAAKGDPFKIMAVFCLVTAAVSMFLPNVTTILLIAPVTLLICDALELDAVPFLITETIASNIGGMATPIGDPSIMMVASKAQLDFLTFLYHITPLIVLVLGAYIVTLKWVFGKWFHIKDELKQRVMSMNENEAINDPMLLRKSLVVLGLTVVGLVISGMLGLKPATIALFGAGILLVVSKTDDPHHILAEAEWGTLFFFMGLFIVVGGAVKVGLMKWVSVKILEITQGNFFLTSMFILWFSAVASALFDNIPYVAAINPLIVDMAKHLWPDLSGIHLLQHADIMPLWISLALGACFGGNGTIIGTSANIVVCGIAEKNGRPISYRRFMRYGIPLMIEFVFISTAYVCFRYYY